MGVSCQDFPPCSPGSTHAAAEAYNGNLHALFSEPKVVLGLCQPRARLRERYTARPASSVRRGAEEC